MKKAYCVFGATFLLGFSFLYYIDLQFNSRLIESYDRIQGSLFTGFLTIGGFLLSLKTFLLLRLKQDIYDHKGYLERVERLRSLDPKIKRYDPLLRLSQLLVFTVFCALCSSISHLTVGYVFRPLGPIFSISISFSTLGLVILNWLVLSRNIKMWMEFIEKHQ